MNQQSAIQNKEQNLKLKNLKYLITAKNVSSVVMSRIVEVAQKTGVAANAYLVAKEGAQAVAALLSGNTVGAIIKGGVAVAAGANVLLNNRPTSTNNELDTALKNIGTELVTAQNAVQQEFAILDQYEVHAKKLEDIQESLKQRDALINNLVNNANAEVSDLASSAYTKAIATNNFLKEAKQALSDLSGILDNLNSKIAAPKKVTVTGLGDSFVNVDANNESTISLAVVEQIQQDFQAFAQSKNQQDAAKIAARIQGSLKELNDLIAAQSDMLQSAKEQANKAFSLVTQAMASNDELASLILNATTKAMENLTNAKALVAQENTTLKNEVAALKATNEQNKAALGTIASSLSKIGTHLDNAIAAAKSMFDIQSVYGTLIVAILATKYLGIIYAAPLSLITLFALKYHKEIKAAYNHWITQFVIKNTASAAYTTVSYTIFAAYYSILASVKAVQIIAAASAPQAR